MTQEQDEIDYNEMDYNKIGINFKTEQRTLIE